MLLGAMLTGWALYRKESADPGPSPTPVLPSRRAGTPGESRRWLVAPDALSFDGFADFICRTKQILPIDDGWEFEAT